MHALRLATLAALILASVTAAPTGKTAGTIAARGDKHTGHATFYNAEMTAGNCGWWSTNADHIVALNTDQYGDTSSVSGWCGKLLRVVNKENGKVRHAVVADSCPTCPAGSLDLTKGLFADLNGGNMDEGMFPIEWSVIF